MSDDLVIRRAGPADRRAALALLAHWKIAPVPASPACPDPERSDLDLSRSFVAMAGSALVGVASWILHADGLGETASLAVAPAWLGRGVGSRLQAARLLDMQRRGVRRVRTEADRPDTIRWCQESFGFEVVGKNPKKHSFGLEDVDHWTVLELDLEGWRP